jgi:hypothetical protein
LLTDFAFDADFFKSAHLTFPWVALPNAGTFIIPTAVLIQCHISCSVDAGLGSELLPASALVEAGVWAQLGVHACLWWILLTYMMPWQM